VKRSVVATFLSLGAFASGAFAAEVSVTGNVVQTLDASDNLFLLKSPSGNTAKYNNLVNLDFRALTPNGRYDLTTSYNYYRYYGPGAQDSPSNVINPPSVNFTGEYYADPLTTYRFNASWSESNVATTLLQQTGTASGQGTSDTTTFGGGFTRQISQTDSTTWSANVTNNSYSDSGQPSSTDYIVNGAWNHQITRATKLVSTIYFDWFSQDDTAKSQRLYWNPMAGLQSQVTPRLFVYATAGAAFVNAYQSGSATSVSNSSFFQPTPGTAQGWLANFNANYVLGKTDNVSLTATRAISPTILGQLQGVESISLSYDHAINSRSGVTFLSQISHTLTAVAPGAIGGGTDFFTASASYRYALAREWHANATYAYNQSNSSSGLARSNTVTLGLTYDFTVFGKPNASIEKTQSELAQQSLTRAQQILPGFRP
jgi:hypothetical protein